MKTDIKNTLNKLLAYARDNLMLDALDETYVLNRLTALAGATAFTPDESADYGDQTLDSLLSELTSAANVRKAEAIDLLLPPSHTLNYYFNDELDRKPKKAFDFLFDICASSGTASNSPAYACGDYIRYAPSELNGNARTVLLPVNDDVKYSPVNLGNHIAVIESDDIISEDILLRESAYVENYGGAIAKRIGDGNNYFACDEFALDKVGVKEQISSGAVKVALLDYPVPVLSFTGIAKNSVRSQAAQVLKTAIEKNINCIAACSARDGITFYLVFANEVNGEYINGSNALVACGVFPTVDFTPLLSVLEKGTALSTDLFRFKTIYNAVGGVKHGSKAQDVLSESLNAVFKAYLTSSASATAEQARSIAQ